MSLDVAGLRARQFAWMDRGDVIYLDSASTGPLPARSVRTAQRLAEVRAEPHRITLEWILETLARGRELCARLVGASPGEIAIATNTSFGINLAARALRLREGDVVVTFDGEFPANVYPWMALARDGVDLVRLPLVGGLPDEEGMLLALDRPHVRAVAVSWVQFASGHRVDLGRLGRACRERGIILVVDAIQGLGAAALDLRTTPVDILACGAQKWLLGPWGSGFTYVREALIEHLEPPVVGWTAMRAPDDFTSLTNYDLTFRDDARRFEVLTLPFHDIAAMNTSLELLFELGTEAVFRRVESLASRAMTRAADLGVDIATSRDAARRAGIVALRPGEAGAAMDRLAAAGVRASLREDLVRLAPHFFNTEEEVDTAIEAVAARR